jgi:hypothetical protein
MMRRRQGLRLALAMTLFSGIGVACASPGLPPGGPPDPDTPKIVRITPDTNAVNVQAKSAFIHFDEVISERPGSGGATSGRTGAMAGPAGSTLASIVSLSPSDGRDEVLWRRTAIEISPRRGFRPNTAYRVTLLPGVADLRGNTISVPTEWVFSTGPTLPTGEVLGAVFDYAAGKTAPNAQVELFFPADTVLRWVARADSSGRFRVRDLTAGTYRVRAYIDANNDRRLGEREAYDTSTVTIDTLGRVDLYAFVRDTMPPRIEQIELVDSTALRLRFDRAIAGDWDPSGAVALLDADSVEIPLGGSLMSSVVYDSLARLEALAAKQAADSLKADSTVADSAATPAPVAARPPAADSLAADSTAADTVVTIPPPRFDRVRPIQQWTVRLTAPLAPGLYKVRVVGAPGLNGKSAESMRDLRIREPEKKPEPKPEPKPDETPAAAPVPPPDPSTRPPQ